jgi:ABC-type Mn2+/Zn2+ transport system permease subunit
VIEFFTEAFEPTFMQRALLGGLIAVVATSIVGTWVVLRGLSFLGDALAHGVIPGIALAVLWGFSPVIGAFVAAIIMSGLVTAVSARTIVREDTAIGLLFVGMLALGIVIVSRARPSRPRSPHCFSATCSVSPQPTSVRRWSLRRSWSSFRW